MWFSKKNNKEQEAKKIILKRFFNSERQKKDVKRAARDSAKEQRALIDRYKEAVGRWDNFLGIFLFQPEGWFSFDVYLIQSVWLFFWNPSRGWGRVSRRTCGISGSIDRAAWREKIPSACMRNCAEYAGSISIGAWCMCSAPRCIMRTRRRRPVIRRSSCGGTGRTSRSIACESGKSSDCFCMVKWREIGVGVYIDETKGVIGKLWGN